MQGRFIVQAFLLWLVVILGCANCNEEGSPETDSSLATSEESDSPTDTDTNDAPEFDTDQCWPVEKRIDFCAAATTKEECQFASPQLPPSECDCEADCGSSCSWIPAVATEIVEDTCAYGEIVFRCLYTSSGEAAFSESPPCDITWNDDAAFFYQDGSVTYLGYFWSGFIGAPESLEFVRCSTKTHKPEPCSCLCDPAFPIQDLGKI